MRAFLTSLCFSCSRRLWRSARSANASAIFIQGLPYCVLTVYQCVTLSVRRFMPTAKNPVHSTSQHECPWNASGAPRRQLSGQGRQHGAEVLIVIVESPITATLTVCRESVDVETSMHLGTRDPQRALRAHQDLSTLAPCASTLFSSAEAARDE